MDINRQNDKIRYWNEEFSLEGSSESVRYEDILKEVSRQQALDMIRMRNNFLLRQACNNGWTDVVRVLISYGLTEKDIRSRCCAAYISAKKYGHEEIVNMLLAVDPTQSEMDEFL